MANFGFGTLGDADDEALRPPHPAAISERMGADMKLSVSVCVVMFLLATAACGRPAPAARETVQLDRTGAPAQPDPLPDGGGLELRVAGTGVVINGHPLSPEELAQLGNGVAPGNYWYDGVAGFWGYVGGPVQGQVLPGYRIGVLRQDASNGNSGTVINGREIPFVEVAWLSRQVPVARGRFWMNPQGVFGYEGGPPLGQIALGGGGGGERRPSLSERGLLFRPGEILLGK